MFVSRPRWFEAVYLISFFAVSEMEGSDDSDINDATDVGENTDDEEASPGAEARPKVDLNKALEAALKENQAAEHDFAGSARPVAKEQPSPANGSEKGVGPSSKFKIPKLPKFQKLGHPPAGERAQDPPEPRGEVGDRSLAVGADVLPRLKKNKSVKINPNPMVSYRQQMADFFESGPEVAGGRSDGPSPQELLVLKKYGFQSNRAPFFKQTVCLFGTQCFSLTATSQVENEDNERKLERHYRLKHPNMDAEELGTEPRGLLRKVEEQWDDNETQLCEARFWAWPGSSMAIAAQMPRKAEGVSKINLLRDAGILITHDHVWQKVADRENTSLKLKSLTDKSLRSEKRARLMTVHDDEGTANVMSEDATEREPGNEREALEAVLTFVAARRLAHPLDIGPLAFQKAIVEAYFAGNLRAPGFSHAFEEYLLDSAVKARQNLPPPTFHDCRSIVERSTQRSLAMRSPRKLQPGFQGGSLALKHEPSTSGFAKPRNKEFKQRKSQDQGRPSRRDFCRGYNDGVCNLAQPGESCTVDGVTKKHACSLFVNQGFCNEPHTRKSHEKRL